MYNLKLCFLVLAILVPKLVPADDKFETVLYKYGYMQKPLGRDKDRAPTEKEMEEAIKKYQAFNGLEVTGVFDEETIKKMGSPRCGLPDYEPGQSRSDRKWLKNDLTWFIEKFSKTPIKKKQQKEAIKKGLARWAEVAKLNFKQGESDSDLKIQFGVKEHGDGFPFDDEGGTLAHAFYPESGKIHFDDSEDWQMDKHVGKNLEVVAAHEFGHTLGLPHSDVPESMMAPYYKGFMEGLHNDDIERIQKLYGPKEESKENIGFCDHKYTTINAAMWVGSSTYLFVDNLFVIDGSTGRKKKTKRIFPGAPNSVDAAIFSQDTQKALLFTDNQVWSYSLSGGKFYLNYGYPKTHSDEVFSKPDAAMIMKDFEHVERVFVFKNDSIREWVPYYEQLTPESTLKYHDFFIGVPNHLDAILSVNKEIAFLSGEKYFTMNADEQIVTESEKDMKSLLGLCNKITK
ncbi:metalloproteinase-19-like [Octopus vulgaris]|uniref:Metalloproteinase-19-like n=1 Tax=Octopus vulgaris TaxID=6645 RepID=A0AA36FKR9_OCTVU|nr:metalloproteinase-19-like [Octopus vulgaris]